MFVPISFIIDLENAGRLQFPKKNGVVDAAQESLRCIAKLIPCSFVMVVYRNNLLSSKACLKLFRMTAIKYLRTSQN